MANIYVSSGTSFSATISITYPAGSTCTVSNYKKTWTAPNTSGNWTFKAHEVGVYTVKAVSGSKSKEREVLITTKGQVETVTLTYELYIFKQGQGAIIPLSVDKEANGHATIGTDKITLSKTSDSSCGVGVYTTAKHNLSQYTTLYADVAMTSQISSLACYLCVKSNSGRLYNEKGIDTEHILAYTPVQIGSSRVSVDISNIADGYIVFGDFKYGEITSIWAQ